MVSYVESHKYDKEEFLAQVKAKIQSKIKEKIPSHTFSAMSMFSIKGGYQMLLGDVCYGYMLSRSREKAMIYLENLKEVEPWARWVMEESQFRDVFLTPFEEACEFGYEIDTNQPTDVVVSAVIILRTPIEHPKTYGWFEKWLEAGLSVPEAIWLSSVCHEWKMEQEPRERFILNLSNVHGVQVTCFTPLKDFVDGVLSSKTHPFNESTARAEGFKPHAECMGVMDGGLVNDLFNEVGLRWGRAQELPLKEEAPLKFFYAYKERFNV